MKRKLLYTIIILLISNVLFCQTWESSGDLAVMRLKKLSEGKYEMKMLMTDGRIFKGTLNRFEIRKDDNYNIIKNSLPSTFNLSKMISQEFCQYEVGGKKGKCALVWLDKPNNFGNVMYWYYYDEWSESYTGVYIPNWDGGFSPSHEFRKIK